MFHMENQQQTCEAVFKFYPIWLSNYVAILHAELFKELTNMTENLWCGPGTFLSGRRQEKESQAFSARECGVVSLLFGRFPQEEHDHWCWLQQLEPTQTPPNVRCWISTSNRHLILLHTFPSPVCVFVACSAGTSVVWVLLVTSLPAATSSSLSPVDSSSEDSLKP